MRVVPVTNNDRRGLRACLHSLLVANHLGTPENAKAFFAVPSCRSSASHGNSELTLLLWRAALPAESIANLGTMDTGGEVRAMLAT